jgi:lysophospholipid acyltransferase (LPLAT)-like uncharacterized protein
LGAFLREPDEKVAVVVAYGFFGSIYSDAFRRLGLQVIRGSTGEDLLKKGGYRAAREMIRTLQSGHSVALAVDVPNIRRIASRGVILVARLSGCPIIPTAITTKARFNLPWRWDKPTVNVPFSILAAAIGAPVFVPPTSECLETKTRELTIALNVATARALEAADG